MKIRKITLVTGILLLAFSATAQDFWHPVALPSAGQDIYVIKKDNNGLLVLGRKNDIFYSSDNGTTWTQSTNWGGYSPNCIGFNPLHHIFIGTPFNGIFRSTDGGATFTEINSGLTTLNVRCFTALSNDTLFIGTATGVFRSVNNGNQWSSFGIGLPQSAINGLSLGTGGYFFAGTDTSGIYRSTNSGATWAACNNGLPAGNGLMYLCAAKQDNKVFAAFSPEGLYRSPDNGDSWSLFNNGLPLNQKAAPGYSLSISMIDIFRLAIFISVFGSGVYVGDINQVNTQMFGSTGSGLPASPSVTTITTSDTKIFAGCQTQGLYSGTYSSAVPEQKGNNTHCWIMNYPNPVTDITKFIFNIPDSRNVCISIFSEPGQEIMTLVNQVFTPGYHEIKWIPEGIGSGYYYYTMKAGDYRVTNKLFYLR